MIDLIKDNIERGVYPLGKRLPSERKLAAEFNVPQSQVRKALRKLVDEGYLDCLRNNGYFVRVNHPESKRRYPVALCIEHPANPSPGSDFYTGMLFNHAPGYDLNLQSFPLPEESGAQNGFFLELLKRGVRGIICFPHTVTEMCPAMLEIIKRGIPLIFWDYSPFHGVFPYVGVDHFLSCFTAAGILSEQKLPVTYIGFEGKEQNQRKHEGFRAGCRASGTDIEAEFLISYDRCQNPGYIYQALKSMEPGRLYFTSTRMLTDMLVGSMMDRGFMPGRDYRLLGTDMLKITDGSSFQLDCMMRDREAIMRALLSMMLDRIRKPDAVACDYRVAMKYIPGKSLP